MTVVKHNLSDAYATGLVLPDCKDTILHCDPLASALNLRIDIMDFIFLIADPIVELFGVNTLNDLGRLSCRDVRDLKRIAVGGSLDVGDEVGVGVLSTYRPDGDVSGGGAFHRVNNGRDGDCTFRA